MPGALRALRNYRIAEALGMSPREVGTYTERELNELDAIAQFVAWQRLPRRGG